MKRLKNLLLFNKFFVLLFFIAIIYVSIFTIFITYHSLYENKNYTINGKILNYNIDGDKLSFIINSKEKIQVNYYIKSLKEKKNLEQNICLGCHIDLSGNIEDIKNNTIPNTFNYKRYLYNKKIYKLLNANILTIKKDNYIFYKIKDNFYKRIDNINNKEYLKIFILGDKRLLSKDEYSKYQINGVAHLLAISGMHIAFIIKFLDVFLKRFKQKQKFTIISILLALYSFLTSFTSSVLRAVLFYVILNIKKIFKINITNIKVLFITAFILIIINPFIIYDIGLIYSFSLTLGILLNSKYIKGSFFRQLLILSYITFIYSIPITVSINYEINLTSIIANLILVPFVTFIVYPFSIITFITPIFSNIYGVFINVLEIINHIFLKLSLIITIPKMSFSLVILYYIVLLINIKVRKKMILIILVLFICWLTPKLDKSYKVIFFDVSQGDSAAIITPNKSKIIVVDTGGITSFNKNKWQEKNNKFYLTNNTIKYLKSNGITKINYLIITHGDYDHMGEAINLVNNYKVEKVIFNCGPYNDLEKELIKVLDKKKIPHYSCIKELNIDKNKLHFLQTNEYDNENDNSNVIYTELDGYKFMFMGDASITTEQEILNKYNLPNIDVLKVGHHGSKTSSGKDFINEINPKYSIISVGKKNRYGHPNKEVLNNLENSKIYRTDQDGSIMFKIKNNELKIETCKP